MPTLHSGFPLISKEMVDFKDWSVFRKNYHTFLPFGLSAVRIPLPKV